MTLPPTQPCPYCEHPVRPGRKCWGCDRDDPIGDESSGDSRADADHLLPGDSRVSGESPRTASVPDSRSESFSFTLPWNCLVSDRERNRAGAGKAHSKKYKQKKALCVARLKKQHHGQPTINQPVRADMLFYPPDRRVRDAPNLFKALLDSVEEAGVVSNDKLIRGGQWWMCEPSSKPRLELTITRVVGMGTAA